MAESHIMSVLDERLDPAKTAPFTLGEGPRQCLLLHGFTGSPWDVRPLAEALALRGGFRAEAVALPGHGTTPRALGEVRWQHWEAAAESALRSLGAGPICVVGLSMGALLATRLAAEHPERVKALALLAPAMRFQGPTMWLLRQARSDRLMPKVRPWVLKESTDLCDPVARADAPVLRAFPIARLLDLWTLQDRAQACLARVRARTLVVTSRQDHVVSLAGARKLMRGLTGALHVRHVELARGFHILPRDEDAGRLSEEVLTFFARVA